MLSSSRFRMLSERASGITNHIFSTWKKVAERFGYQEYAASLLESAELYRSKGNDEIVNEQMFTFKDRGDREVALRPEMTPSLARMVAAKRKSLKFPLRWYTIANCFRYERPQRGRRREHWQLNADVMGIAGVEAEVEIISLAHAIMKEFGAKGEDFVIHVNNKKEVSAALLEAGVEKENINALFRLFDKKEKISEEQYIEEELKLVKDVKKLNEVIESQILLSNDADSSLGNWFQKVVSGVKEKTGVSPNISFNPYLARGFDYYTGMIFEVFDTHEDNRRSLFGGGRYDNLLELFGVDPVPTVGFGMGDVTIRDFLETHGLRTTDK